MIIAYMLAGHDDESYMLGTETYRPPEADRYRFHDWRFGRDGAAHHATCATCGRRTDPNFVNPSFRVKKRRKDITTSYDGYTFFSERLLRRLPDAGWAVDQFVPLPADRQFYWLRPANVLKFRGSLSQPCASCKGYCSVIAPEPIFSHSSGEPLTEGVWRSDLEFGSGPEQSPVIVLGVVTAKRLQALRPAGAVLLPIRKTVGPNAA